MASSAAFELILELNDKASKGLNNAAKEGGFLKNALSFATGGAILGGIQAIGGAAKDMFTDAIGEAKEWNTQLAQVDSVLASTGGKAGLTKDAILELNKSLSAGGGFSAAADDAVLQGQNMLLTFTNIGKDVFPDATKAMLDMATKMNGGVTPSADQLSQTSVQLGKALQDPIKGVGALSRVGVAFTAQQKEQIATMVAAGDTMGAQKLILGELATEFGGSATAAMGTFEGQQQLLNESFNNVKQTIGEALMPILQQLMGWLSSPEVQAGIQALATAVGDLLVGGFNLLKDTVSALQPIVQAVWGFIESTVIPIAQQVFSVLSQWWTEMQPGLQAAWNAISTAITDAWNTIQPLIEQGMAFIKNLWDAVWPGIQQTFSGVWTAIQGALQVGWSVISGIWNTVTSILKGDWEGAWNAIKGMFEGVWTGIQTFLGGVWDTIKGIWNTGTSYLKTIWENVWNGIKGFFEGIWNGISSFVTGAIQAVQNIITIKVAEIKLRWELFWNDIKNFFTGAWDFITVELPKKLAEVWNTLTSWIGTTAANVVETVKSIGSNIVEGIKNGISGAWDAFVNWVMSLLGGIVDGIKDFFGISSPSRLFAEEIGRPMVEGMAVGWSAAIPGLRATMIGDMDNLGGEILKRAQQIADMASNLMMSGSATSTGTGIG